MRCYAAKKEVGAIYLKGEELKTTDMTSELYARLKNLGIVLSVNDGRLDIQAPEGVLGEELINEIRGRKVELIDLIQSYKRQQKGFASIPRIELQESYLLSSAQKRLWVLNQFEKESAAYNRTAVYSFSGVLDIAALSYAFDNLIKRHEILRTVFREDEQAGARQCIVDAGTSGFVISYHDLSDVQEKDAAVRNAIWEESTQPFDLALGPLLRARLYRTDNEKYVFVYTMHHIISDGWSMMVFIDEILRYYRSFTRMEDAALPPLQLQYKDYASWQQRQLADESMEYHKKFWLKQFEGDLPVFNLPGDRPRPSLKTYRGGVVHITIDNELTGMLKPLLQKYGGTLFMGLLAAVNAVLYRCTNQQDIIIGSPIAGRDHIDLEGQIGFYVNTLALRTRFSGKDSYCELLQKVKEVTIGAYEHQVYPFDELVDALQLPRDMSRNALFEVMVALQNPESREREQTIGKLHINRYDDSIFYTSKFDLFFNFIESGTYVAGNIEYNSDIYDARTITALADHFVQLLRSAVNNPDLSIGKLAMMHESEISKILFGFNKTSIHFTGDRTLVQLFEAQVKKTPEKTAIICGDQEFSYKDLNQRVNQLANYLRTCHSIGAGDLVGLLLDRSEWMVIGMLGVLKAGAAYLPVDIEANRSRIVSVLENAAIQVLLTDGRHIDLCDSIQWDTASCKSFICLDEWEAEDYSISDEGAKKLWDYVAETSDDIITASGWRNSYTGQPFSKAEMDEFVDNVLEKVRPFLRPGTRVLEIGCGSGLVLHRIAPYAGHYTGTDISGEALDICRMGIKDNSIGNVELHCLSAIETEILSGREFDIILVNSVIQYFPSYQYLRTFLSQLNGLLSEKGVLFLGDIRDKSKQLDYYRTLFEGSDHIMSRMADKKSSDKELFLDQHFFTDYYFAMPFQCKIDFSGKIGDISNELTLFRYDAVIHLNKTSERNDVPYTVCKRQVLDRPFCLASRENPVHINKPDDLAYLIYTSGSTGKPKGVMIEHRNVAAFFQNMSSRLFLREDMTLAGITHYTFDISVLELIGTLVSGLTLFLLRDTDPMHILKCIAERNFNAMQITPSRLSQLLANGLEAEETLRELEVILVGGEALGDANYKYLRGLKDTKTINVYGPTETTIWSSSLELHSCDGLSIGCPLLHEHIYIVDTNFNLCPIGVAGEICIGGSGVARGYLHEPEITAAKFIPNPFAPGRMYRTGDLGRWLPDGNIAFIGRDDEQVKLRGYRIELAEIEHAILTYGHIDASVVVMRSNPAGESELIACVISRHVLNLSELRSYLSRSLPVYMIPSHFFVLPELPLTASGKVDKKRLTSVQDPGLQSGTIYKPPGNDMEKKMELIWRQVLGKERIGVQESFFSIGGNSLNAIRILSKLRSEFDVEIKITEVFNYPTIEHLAKEVVRRMWANRTPELSEDDLIVTI